MKKTNNKGFSLVELIVVIAIMAVLIGVLAPQFLKYVERSRKSTDVQNVAAITTAIKTYAVDPLASTTLTTGNVTLTTSDVAVSSTNCTGGSDVALTEAGITEVGLSSSKWGSGDITIGFTVETSGNVTFTETGLASGFSILNGVYTEGSASGSGN